MLNEYIPLKVKMMVYTLLPFWYASIARGKLVEVFSCRNCVGRLMRMNPVVKFSLMVNKSAVALKKYSSTPRIACDVTNSVCSWACSDESQFPNDMAN